MFLKKRGIFICLALILICLNVLNASGVAAGTIINASSQNVQLSFTEAGTTNIKLASDFDIDDWETKVLAIHGLLPGTATSTLPGFSEETPFYNNVTPDSYVFTFPVINRSNESVTIDITATHNQETTHWLLANSDAVFCPEDQMATFVVTLSASVLEALERVTLNTTVTLTETPSTKNIVSYNMFDMAVGAMANGGYGGTENVSYLYTLQAVGFNLEILSKTFVVTHPSGDLSGEEPFPGSKITYTVVVKNNSVSNALNVSLNDVIPNNCHLYFDDMPTVAGASNLWEAADDFSPTVNATTGGGEIITFGNINIDADKKITLNYTVTVD